MKQSKSWITLTGAGALTAVLLLTPACGSKNKPQDSAKPSTAAGTSASATAAVTHQGSAASPNTGTKSWSQPPAMQINPDKSYSALVKTSKGSFTIQLFAKDAPKAVNNFVFLSNQHFYDGIVFHRIIQTFMIQTGDPKGNGTGGPGYKFDHEPTQYTYDKGIVAYANSGPNTNGSQFFIVTGEEGSFLNQHPDYTIFGKVTDGMDSVDKIAQTPVQTNQRSGEKSQPTEKVTIDSITISEK